MSRGIEQALNQSNYSVRVEGVSSGTVIPVTEAVPGSVGHGRKTVAAAGTDEALAASTSIKSVVITAETDNTGVICVGGSGVDATLATRTGAPLNAGESISLDIDNLADVYIDSTVNGDGVTYMYTV